MVTDKTKRKEERREGASGQGQHSNGNGRHLSGAENVRGTVLSALRGQLSSRSLKVVL